MFKGIFRWKPLDDEAPLYFDIKDNFPDEDAVKEHAEKRLYDKYEAIPYSRNVAVPVIVITLIIILVVVIAFLK